MTLYYAKGSSRTELSPAELRGGLYEALDQLGPRRRVLALPPDHTRIHGLAGPLTAAAYDYYGPALTDVMPTLGTHAAMTAEQLQRMFPGVPPGLFRVHRWREDVLTIGHVPEDFVAQAAGGLWRRPFPVQLNRLIWEGGHDLVLSVGQVLPHEVMGMAGYNKNLFVGCGGAEGINHSHFIGAIHGMERIMGRADTPPRRILNEAQARFCRDLPVVFVLTVLGPSENGGHVARGLFVGDDAECFQRAAALAAEVNIELLDQLPDTVVAYLDPDEYHSTWLGNKAIYRTRMAVADGGELVILAPGVGRFGEDPRIDALIRKYGYRPSADILRLVEQNADLAENLSAAAHLIHGSPEGRFKVTYCPGRLTRQEIESVGFAYGDLGEMQRFYAPGRLNDGWNSLPDGRRVFFISNPGLGLWSSRRRFGGDVSPPKSSKPKISAS